MAPTFHAGGRGFGLRNSPSNFTFNHIGHFAAAGHAIAKGLFLGGVTRRFPDLNFAFLEGGVGWGCQLFADLIEHWERRGAKGIAYMDPKKLDRTLLRSLVDKYGYDDIAAELDRRDGWPQRGGGRPDRRRAGARRLRRLQDHAQGGLGRPLCQAVLFRLRGRRPHERDGVRPGQSVRRADQRDLQLRYRPFRRARHAEPGARGPRAGRGRADHRRTISATSPSPMPCACGARRTRASSRARRWPRKRRRCYRAAPSAPPRSNWSQQVSCARALEYHAAVINAVRNCRPSAKLAREGRSRKSRNSFPRLCGCVDLAAAEAVAFNARLKAEIEKIISPRPKVPSGSNWQTPQDLHTRPAFADFTRLVEIVARSVAQYLQVEQYPMMITGCWANINPPGTYHPTHNHPNNYLSGVYYVAVPETGSHLIFQDPRPVLDHAAGRQARPRHRQCRCRAAPAGPHGDLPVLASPPRPLQRGHDRAHQHLVQSHVHGFAETPPRRAGRRAPNQPRHRRFAFHSAGTPPMPIRQAFRRFRPASCATPPLERRGNWQHAKRVIPIDRALKRENPYAPYCSRVSPCFLSQACGASIGPRRARAPAPRSAGRGS